MRPLSREERHLIELLAAKLDVKTRVRLLEDLASARVVQEAADGAVLTFELEGYQRPKEPGQCLYPIEAELGAADDTITILLYADSNGRLLELEFINWSEKAAVDTSWRDLRIW